MDPAIAGTFSPPAQRANSRRVANADGSLDLEIYRIAETELPLGLTVLVASNDRVVHEAGTQLTKNIVETREGGFRIYTLRLGGETMPPGHYVAHRLAKRLTASAHGAVDYGTFPFVVPDTPFTRPLYSSYRTSQELVQTVVDQLLRDDLLQGVVDQAVSEQLVDITHWQVWIR
jgi:hypothetical protein